MASPLPMQLVVHALTANNKWQQAITFSFYYMILLPGFLECLIISSSGARSIEKLLCDMGSSYLIEPLVSMCESSKIPLCS